MRPNRTDFAMEEIGSLRPPVSTGTHSSNSSLLGHCIQRRAGFKGTSHRSSFRMRCRKTIDASMSGDRGGRRRLYSCILYEQSGPRALPRSVRYRYGRSLGAGVGATLRGKRGSHACMCTTPLDPTKLACTARLCKDARALRLCRRATARQLASRASKKAGVHYWKNRNSRPQEQPITNN